MDTCAYMPYVLIFSFVTVTTHHSLSRAAPPPSPRRSRRPERCIGGSEVLWSISGSRMVSRRGVPPSEEVKDPSRQGVPCEYPRPFSPAAVLKRILRRRWSPVGAAVTPLGAPPSVRTPQRGAAEWLVAVWPTAPLTPSAAGGSPGRPPSPPPRRRGLAPFLLASPNRSAGRGRSYPQGRLQPRALGVPLEGQVSGAGGAFQEGAEVRAVARIMGPAATPSSITRTQKANKFVFRPGHKGRPGRGALFASCERRFLGGK